ncbi:MAG: 3-oxoacyl-ACP reductase FabG [Bacillota bacterium]|nr:3-oxoacyl-ACP reductase FabG [Bacillota bacterium]
MLLENKVAIITGSGQGIGEAIAKKFSREGAIVVIDDIIQERIDRVVGDITQDGNPVVGINADISNYEQVQSMMQQVLDTFGNIDIVVNNAGITRDVTLLKMQEIQWDEVLAVNLKGAFNCIRHAAPVMKANQGGKVINISSAVRFGNIGQANYSSSKKGLIGLTRTVAKELGRFGVNVNAIAPGYIETKMLDSIPPEIKKMALQSVPLKKAGSVDDIANLCLFLASSQSDYISGQVIHCDGGLVMP